MGGDLGRNEIDEDGGNAAYTGEDRNASLYLHFGPSLAWERALVELADGIIDVSPLPSGYSREAHGRLIFTERIGGKGWKKKDHHPNPNKSISVVDVGGHSSRNRNSTLGGTRIRASSTSNSLLKGFSNTVVNYVCDDASVRAIRLRTGT
mmetsp:Transcript_12767/g.18188  ORF Transcript_12767/g.18188 Transcript_12767/m.18188 type:complete len:150 (-) Transcript_12767:35-484(-)